MCWLMLPFVGGPEETVRGVDGWIGDVGRYALVGQNGVGKTTLLNAINRRNINGFPTAVKIFFIEHEVQWCRSIAVASLPASCAVLSSLLPPSLCVSGTRLHLFVSIYLSVFVCSDPVSVSCLLSPVSCLLSPVSCLLSPVSCLLPLSL